MSRAFRITIASFILGLGVTQLAAAAVNQPLQAASGPVQFAIGTYTRSGRSTLGTLWGWHTASAADVGGLNLANATLTGPPDWNNGSPVHGCAVFNGAAPTICIGWRTAPVVKGQYTALSSAGSWRATASTASSITAPRISTAFASGTSVSVAWKPVAGAHSYIVAVTPATSGTCCDLQNHVVHSRTDSYVLRNVALQTGRRYRIGVFALSFDISKDAPLTKPFAIAEGRITVTAGAKPVKVKRARTAKKSAAAPAKTMSAQVHGSALVGASSIKILDLRVEGLPARTLVIFRCVKGCKASEDLSGSGVVNSRVLRNFTVPVGSVIEIRATKTGYVGFYDRLVIHATALGFFTETKECLPPNGRKPHACKNGH